MLAEKYWEKILKDIDENGGYFLPSTDAQDAFNILVDHFLGEDFYIVDPVNNGQANTVLVYEILLRNQKARDKKEKTRDKLISLINKVLK